MEQLALSALIDVCKNGVLEASRAALRLQAMTQDEARAVLQATDGGENPNNLLDDTILQAQGVSPKGLDEAVTKRLTQAGVKQSSAEALSQGRFEEHLRAFRKDGSLLPLYVPRDTKILDYSRELLFNDMVYYLRAAGFAGGYLFIDDIENLVDQMARRHRLEFAKNFGLCTVRPGYANTAYNFFSCVLTTHQQSAIGLSQAWGEAGLSAIARLDPTSPNSVEMPLPTKDEARGIVIAHLDHYRLDPADRNTSKPFTEDGIDVLLKNRQHPRDLLSNAAKVLLHAVQEGATSIDAGLVKTATDNTLSIATEDFTEGIEDAV